MDAAVEQEALLTYTEAAERAQISERTLMRLKLARLVRCFEPTKGTVRFLWSELLEDLRSPKVRRAIAEEGRSEPPVKV